MGAPNLGFINSIFVSAYIKGASDTETQVLNAFNAVKLYNRRIRWIEPEFVTANIAITGKIHRSRTIENVSGTVSAALDAAYGKDSASRKSQLLIKDVYQVIAGTGLFDEDGAAFSVSTSGATQAEKMKQMLCLGTVTFSLEYI